MNSAARPAERPRWRVLLNGFALFHAGNMVLAMATSLLMLLVLSHILPRGRYDGVVFLTAIGLYFTPFDVALGKAGYASMRAAAAGSDSLGATDGVRLALFAQLVISLVAVLVAPSFVDSFGSSPWIEDALYFGLCRLFNLWSCQMQPLAWALGCNAIFVRISTAIRLFQVCGLLVAMAFGSYLAFGVVSVASSVACVWLGFVLFARHGFFRQPDGARGLREDGASFVVALMGSGVDVMVYNAPYILVSACYGIGPMLVVLDSVMKVARIAMTGARTLSEIALPTQRTKFESGGGGRKVYAATVLACTLCSALPALLIVMDGRAVFHLLLGPNDVVEAAAFMPAAALVVVLGAYQASSFFLSYVNDGPAMRRLTLAAACGFGATAIAVWWFHPSPATVLTVFAVYLTAMVAYAIRLSLSLLRAHGRPGRSGGGGLSPWLGRLLPRPSAA